MKNEVESLRVVIIRGSLLFPPKEAAKPAALQNRRLLQSGKNQGGAVITICVNMNILHLHTDFVFD